MQVVSPEHIGLKRPDVWVPEPMDTVDLKRMARTKESNFCFCYSLSSNYSVMKIVC